MAYLQSSFVERGFSVNQLTIDDNMQWKLIVLQRLIYDRLKQDECPVSEFTISEDLRKSCLLASQRDKSDLGNINSDKKNANISLKRSPKLQEIEESEAAGVRTLSKKTRCSRDDQCCV